MKKIVFATGNAGKMKEIREILADLPVEIYSMKEAGISVEIDENGKTFEENAKIKAQTVAGCTDGDTIVLADDSGLEVDALNGEPGVYSARYAPGGHDASDKEKYMYLLSKLEGVTDRRAKFVSSICCLLPDGTEIRTEGECCGHILTEPHGEGGFGYDPVFMPTGYDKSMAELGTGVKNEISHRANALKIFKKKLREYNGTDK